MQKSYGENPIQRWGGAALGTFGAILLVVALTHDFRNNRGVRPPSTGRGIALTTGVIGGLLAVLGLGLVLVDSGITIDTARKTVRPWSRIWPFRFGPERPLSDFDRVRIATTELGRTTTRYRILLAGRGKPVEFDDYFIDRDAALKFAREIALVVGLPVEGDVPPVPTRDQVNRALEVWQAFGPERREQPEERWGRQLPEIPAAAHPSLRARIEEIEAAAAELAGRVLDRELTQEAGQAELARRFPELDPGRLTTLWGQAIYFAAK